MIIRSLSLVSGIVPVILLAPVSSNGNAPAKSMKSPNIICILIDDVSANEFNCYNGPGINTPTFDKMAREGVQFTTGWSQPLCGPTRATLLTAKYASKNGHYSNAFSPKVSIHNTHYTMGKAMRDAGYNTAWFGKQHIDRQLNPSDFGFDYYLVAKYWEGYDGPVQGLEPPGTNRLSMYGAQWYWHPGLIANGKGIPTSPNDFGPKIELDSLLSFVGRKSEKPLFVYWPTNLPHHEYQGKIKSWVRPDVPEFDKNGKLTGKRIKGTMQSNLEFVDFAMSRIVDMLIAMNELNNTIFFLMGDNGTAGYGKGKPESEIAIHVPFLVWGPKLLKVKGPSEVLVDFTDLLPTFMDLAGFKNEYRKDMDGHSFAPFLLGEKFRPRKWISAQLDSARWIRTREWLLDGKGELWYCGKEFDERKFINLSQSDKKADMKKKKEMQKLMNENIPSLGKFFINRMSKVKKS